MFPRYYLCIDVCLPVRLGSCVLHHNRDSRAGWIQAETKPTTEDWRRIGELQTGVRPNRNTVHRGNRKESTQSVDKVTKKQADTSQDRRNPKSKKADISHDRCNQTKKADSSQDALVVAVRDAALRRLSTEEADALPKRLYEQVKFWHTYKDDARFVQHMSRDDIMIIQDWRKRQAKGQSQRTFGRQRNGNVFGWCFYYQFDGRFPPFCFFASFPSLSWPHFYCRCPHGTDCEYLHSFGTLRLLFLDCPRDSHSFILF